MCPGPIYQCNSAEGRILPRFLSGQAPIPVASKVQTKFSRIIQFLYGPYFKVSGFFYRIYSANRARVERLKANQTFSALLRGLTLLVLLGWILVWLFAPDESRTGLVDEVRQSIGASDSKATRADPGVTD